MAGPNPTTKSCSKCSGVFPADLNSFPPSANTKSGLGSWCRPCVRALGRENFHERREVVRLTCARCGVEFDRKKMIEQRRIREDQCGPYCTKTCVANRKPTGAGVYVIRHVPTGRVYVGSSGNIRRRWDTHRSALNLGKAQNPGLQAAWSADGPGAFEFEIVEPVNGGRAERLAAEALWIERLDATNPALGFCVFPDGHSPKGRDVSPEFRQQLRALLRRNLARLTPEGVARIRAMRANGMTGAAIARAMGVSKSTARQVYLRLTWRDLP